MKATKDCSSHEECVFMVRIFDENWAEIKGLSMCTNDITTIASILQKVRLTYWERDNLLEPHTYPAYAKAFGADVEVFRGE